MRRRHAGFLAALLLGAGALVYLWPDRHTTQLDLPIPVSPGGSEPLQPSAAVSTVFLPVSIPIQTIRDRLNAAVPLTASGSEDDPVKHKAVVDDVLNWTARRGPIDVRGDSDRLHLQTATNGRADIRGLVRPVRGALGDILRGVSGGASDLPLQLHADINASIAAVIRPELLRDWHIRPNIAARIEVQKAELPVGGVATVDLRSGVHAALDRKVQPLIRQLEQRIADDRRLHALAVREWARLHKVERLSDRPASWLVVRPLGAEASPVRIDRQAVRLGLGIRADTRVVFAGERPANPVGALPPLTFTAEKQGQIRLNTLASIPWDQLGRAVSQELVGQVVSGSNGTVLNVREASLSPWGDGLLLTLDMDARQGTLYETRGRVYLTALPRLDVAAQTLYLDDIDFAIETRDSLAGLAGWLMESTILEGLQARASLDFSAHVARAREKAEMAIRHFVAEAPDGVVLSAQVEEMGVGDLRVAPDSLQILFNARASLDAAVTRLAF